MSGIPSGSAFDAELIRIQEVSPAEAQIIGQYRAVAGKFVELWMEIDRRTEYAEWREDGIGSCRVSPRPFGNSRDGFDAYVDGPASQHIENLWDALAKDDPPRPEHQRRMACKFHRVGKGCVLDDLKSPRCIDHTDSTHTREIREKLGIKLPDFVTPLATIQIGGLDIRNGSFDLHPDINEELVKETIAGTQALIDQIRTFPVLYPIDSEQST